jgi:hypothetical protein
MANVQLNAVIWGELSKYVDLGAIERCLQILEPHISQSIPRFVSLGNDRRLNGPR